jgi:hypothetical protein
MTYTYAILEVSPPTYDEIAAKLREAGYDHAFNAEGEIDLHGLALTKAAGFRPATSGTSLALQSILALARVKTNEWENAKTIWAIKALAEAGLK